MRMSRKSPKAIDKRQENITITDKFRQYPASQVP